MSRETFIGPPPCSEDLYTIKGCGRGRSILFSGVTTVYSRKRTTVMKLDMKGGEIAETRKGESRRGRAQKRVTEDCDMYMSTRENVMRVYFSLQFQV